MERAEDSVLCVFTKDKTLANLPWRELLVPSGTDVERAWVAQVCAPKGVAPPPSTGKPRMLLAGWSSGAGYTMPGVQRELNDFSGKVGRDQLDVRQLAEATSARLLDACKTPGTMFLHLSPPALMRNLADELSIPVTASGGAGERPAQFDTVTLKHLNQALDANDDLRMVVVNACSAGQGCAQISRHLGVVAIGWPGLVMDDTAADFTFYFYQRLLEGLTPIAAVRSFAQTVGLARIAVDVPIVWLPSPEWAGWCPFPATAPEAPAEARAAKAARGAKKAKRAKGNPPWWRVPRGPRMRRRPHRKPRRLPRSWPPRRRLRRPGCRPGPNWSSVHGPPSTPRSW